jgi:hypothetical protein
MVRWSMVRGSMVRGYEVRSGGRRSVDGPASGIGPSDRTLAPSDRTFAPSHRRTLEPPICYQSSMRDHDLVMLARETPAHHARAGAFDVDVIDRRYVERQQLRYEQSTNDRQSERPA